MSSGPIPNSLNPNSETGREKTQIHQNTATKYPTEEAYLVKNKYFVPKREKLMTPTKAPERRYPKTSYNSILSRVHRLVEKQTKHHSQYGNSKNTPPKGKLSSKDKGVKATSVNGGR